MLWWEPHMSRVVCTNLLQIYTPYSPVNFQPNIIRTLQVYPVNNPVITRKPIPLSHRFYYQWFEYLRIKLCLNSVVTREIIILLRYKTLWRISSQPKKTNITFQYINLITLLTVSVKYLFYFWIQYNTPSLWWPLAHKHQFKACCMYLLSNSSTRFGQKMATFSGWNKDKHIVQRLRNESFMFVCHYTSQFLFKIFFNLTTTHIII